MTRLGLRFMGLHEGASQGCSDNYHPYVRVNGFLSSCAHLEMLGDGIASQMASQMLLIVTLAQLICLLLYILYREVLTIKCFAVYCCSYQSGNAENTEMDSPFG